MAIKVLDVSAGNRAIWFDKNNGCATFVDVRSEVGPTIVADSRALPFADGTFDLVVFDPPHLNFGANAAMSKTYGWHTTAEIRQIVEETAREVHRVTRVDALMAFKWNDHDQRLEKMIALLAYFWEPLFGHKVATRTKHASSTTWALLHRRTVETVEEVPFGRDT